MTFQFIVKTIVYSSRMYEKNVFFTLRQGREQVKCQIKLNAIPRVQEY